MNVEVMRLKQEGVGSRFIVVVKEVLEGMCVALLWKVFWSNIGLPVKLIDESLAQDG